MTLADSITRMRRFLRDPDGLIWTDEDLRLWFNEAQLEIAQKAGALEIVKAQYYPPQYTYSYCNDWERANIEGDQYQALIPNQTTGHVCSAVWETGWWLDDNTVPGDGYYFTHPWEGHMATPGVPVEAPLPERFHKMKFIAFDLEEITPVGLKELAEQDRFYQTRSGKTINYYRPDEQGNKLILYPRPSTIVWDSPDISEVMDDDGGIISSSEAWIVYDELGVGTDAIDADGQLLMVYEYLPADMDEASDTPEWPAWMVRVVEYGTLERAFSADTDGFIPSLRDYWKMRKDVAIQALRKAKRLRVTDRDFRLGKGDKQNIRRRPTLGEHYPSTWP